MSDSTERFHGTEEEPTVLDSVLTDEKGEEVSADELRQLIDQMSGVPENASMGSLQDLQTIGFGGIGVVFAAHEPGLRREIAVKVLRPHYRHQLKRVREFIREARITAQIDHPNVIPVHRLGVFDDAGVFFTMKRVQGVSLLTVLHELKNGNPKYRQKYTRFTLLNVFAAICNGVAFAHSRGIIHRDLKPGNIMLGDYGEVFIMDWGLAEYRADRDRSSSEHKIQLPQDPAAVRLQTARHILSGTPAYMSPEQANGLSEAVDERSDVYGLGAILYSILTWQNTPFADHLPRETILQLAQTGRFRSPRRRAPGRHVPRELEAICLKAMAHDPGKRYQSVSALLADVRRFADKAPVEAYSRRWWYRGLKFLLRHPLIPCAVMAALLAVGLWNAQEWLLHFGEKGSLRELIQSDLQQAHAAREYALLRYQQLQQHYHRQGSTEAVGNEALLYRQFQGARATYEMQFANVQDLLLRLSRLEGNPPGSERPLADLFCRMLEFAYQTDNYPLAARTVARLRLLPQKVQKQLLQDPELVRQNDRVTANCGELKLITDPADLPVRIVPVRMAENSEMESPEPADSFEIDAPTALTPLERSLPAGQYQLVLNAADRTAVTMPVMVRYGRCTELSLTLPETIPAGTVYVPPGEFVFGNTAGEGLAARMWLAGFFIDRCEVTLREYREFWLSLPPPLRQRFLPMPVVDEESGRRLPAWDWRGELQSDRKLTWSTPVTGITPTAAEAFCQWRSKRTGLVWRLPTAQEWEKAARGVDGRHYAWGEGAAPAGILLPGNPASKAYPYGAPVEQTGTDRSVYGVWGMSGNVRELVQLPLGDAEERYGIKGGSTAAGLRFANPAVTAYASGNAGDAGFRCVAEVNEKNQESHKP